MARREQRDTYHHGDLKHALTEAARDLVKERGPRGFTLREVARRAGVSAAAPYRHFSDKAEILAAVATQGFVQLHEAVSAAGAAESDVRARAIGMGRAYVGWAVQHPDYYQAMFGSDTDRGAYPDLLAAASRAFDELLHAIAQCQEANLLPRDDPRNAAGPTWSVLHGIASLTIGHNLVNVDIREDPQALAGRALEALLFAERH